MAEPASEPGKIPYIIETVVGAALAVWAWICLRSVRHGEKLAAIEGSMVKRVDMDRFQLERREAFEKFEREQRARQDELRESMMESLDLRFKHLSRQQRKMHNQNRKALAQLMEKPHDGR